MGREAGTCTERESASEEEHETESDVAHAKVYITLERLNLCKETSLMFVFPKQEFVPESTQILFAKISVSAYLYFSYFSQLLPSLQSV